MFKTIMVPVDLAHMDKLGPALAAAGDMAKTWQATVTYVGVTSDAPGSLGHTPQEYEARLNEFAAAQGKQHGQPASGMAITSNDPAAELDDALLKAIDDTGADLVVMSSHKPGIREYIWSSNGGKLANHAGISVMLVRA